MRFLPAVCTLIVCLLASGVISSAEASELEDEVNYYRNACIAAYYADKSQEEIVAEMIAQNTAEPFLARLAIGAPQNWKQLADKTIPVEKRLEVAVGLVGMAISHGSSEEKRIAKAYSAMFFPVPTSEDCQLPEGLAEFVKKNNFWR